MARYNAMEETFEEIEVFGKPALFTIIRIDRNTVPEGLYLYEVRGDDDGGSDPVQIAENIVVNHYGSIITSEPLMLSNGYLDINPEEDWNFIGGDTTVEEFYNK